MFEEVVLKKIYSYLAHNKILKRQIDIFQCLIIPDKLQNQVKDLDPKLQMRYI
jgi:hypothetical protein